MRTIVFLLCMCFGVQGLKGVTNVTLGSLPLKERNRRLIPYMNYYIGQQQNPQYRQLIAIPVPPAQQYRQQQLQRFIPQQQTPLTRMITQNYLALSKQLAGNPRLQMRVLPQNVHPVDPKYLIPVPNQHQNIVRIPLEQYHKQQNVQYVRPQQQEQQQYARPEEENDYDPREEEPPVVQYVKPPPDVLLQYVKPEVQQYITKIRGQQALYTKQQEQEDYNQQQNIPVQFVAKAPRPQQYAEQVEPIYGQRQQVQEAPTQYFQKPIIRYFHKLALPPGSKLAPLPAEIPEYITRPNNKQAENEQKEEPTVTIMQSQEIDVEPLPSTPAPTPKYHATYVEKPESLDDFRTFQPSQHYPQEEQKNEDLDPEIVDKNLNEVLQGLSISKTLPDRITTENLGESISKLSKILRILQRAHSLPQAAKDLITYPKPVILKAKVPKIQIQPQSHANDGSTPGRPGIDYPNYDEIPPTRFSCKDQRYKGFFGDPETGCQVWHYCDLNGGQASFLCPNGTIFSQAALTCDWWFNVKCASTAQLYVLNERLYKYILPHKPSFPEDYSGPLVDHYLTLKFKEIEEKNKNKTEESKESPKEEEYEPPFSIDVETQNKVRSAS